MLNFTQPDVILPTTADDDPRLGHLLGTRLAGGTAPRVVLVGFPSDEGVHRNGGRVGAAGVVIGRGIPPRARGAGCDRRGS